MADHKQLEAPFKNDIAALSQTTKNSTQNTPIKTPNFAHTWNGSIHSRLLVQTKPHGNKDAEISAMQVNIDAIQKSTNIPDGMTIQELKQEMSGDEHIQQLKEHIIKGWPENIDQISQDTRAYWTF